MALGTIPFCSSCSLLPILFLCLTFTQRSEGHGYMIDPPARSSMWRVGFSTPVNYDDNALRCGGSRTSCGVCGDPFGGPREHETGGRFATGAIAKNYRQGEEVNVRIMVTANHQGWFYFHLCARDDPSHQETEQCLEKVPLSLADGRNRFHLRDRVFGVVNVRVKLPDSVACTHCVLRWKWITGNSWGRDLRTGEGCLGCGPQEQFYGCADINIRPRAGAAQNQPQPAQSGFPGNALNKPPVTTTTARSYIGGKAGAIGGGNNNNNGGKPDVTRKCLAVNNWEGDPELDRWCDVNCNGARSSRFCPPIFCSCQLM